MRNRNRDKASRRARRVKRERTPSLAASEAQLAAIDPTVLAAGWLSALRPQMGPFRDLLAEVAGSTAGGEDRVLVGESAWAAIEAAHERVFSVSGSTVNVLSPAEWLWWLRRAAPEFGQINELATTGPYVLRLAEALSTLSTELKSPTVPNPNSILYFDPRPEVLVALSEMFEIAALLYDLHSAARWAGKGASILVGTGHAPSPQPAELLAASVQLYDQRNVESGGNFLVRAGLHLGPTLSMPVLDPETIASHILVMGARGTGQRPWPIGLMDLRQIPTLTDDALPLDLRWPQSIVDLVALNHALMFSTELHRTMDSPLHPVRRVGYRVVMRDMLLSELDDAVGILRMIRLHGFLPDAVAIDDAPAILDRLATLEATIWPPSYGAPLRDLGENRLIVDVVGATQRLTQALQRPIHQGGDVNRWAGHFERSVQAVLDLSPWKPSDRLPPPRRQLRLRSTRITDVDAWGERDGIVLAVSCKSRPYTDGYDRGAYDAVTRVARAAVDAVRDWRDKVATLQSSPVGDNYDLTWARRIVPVVVFPFIPFTPIGPETEEVLPGLRAVAGSAEFTRWVEVAGSIGVDDLLDHK